MKKGKMIVVSTALVLLVCGKLHAQVSPKAAQVAGVIADKMKDSLNLSKEKRNQVYAINMELHNQKTAIRQQNTDKNSMQVEIQRVERSRDSLYQTILPADKYQLYLQKKRNLVSAN